MGKGKRVRQLLLCVGVGLRTMVAAAGMGLSDRPAGMAAARGDRGCGGQKTKVLWAADARGGGPNSLALSFVYCLKGRSEAKLPTVCLGRVADVCRYCHEST